MKCVECGNSFIPLDDEHDICSECDDFNNDDFDDENDRLLEQQEMADFERSDEYYGSYYDDFLDPPNPYDGDY